MNEQQASLLHDEGMRDLEQHHAAVAGSVASALRGPQKPDPRAAEKAAYDQVLRDSAADYESGKIAANPIDQAAADFKAGTNIHNTNMPSTAAGAVEVAPGDVDDLDRAAAADLLGFDLGQLETLKFDNHDSFVNFIGPELEELERSVSDDDTRAAMQAARSDPRILPRIFAELEVWRSPRYGRSDGRDAQQQQRTVAVIANAFRQAVALGRAGMPVPKIEILMRRGRITEGDPDYSPGKTGHTSKQISTASQYRNIHELYGYNPHR